MIFKNYYSRLAMLCMGIVCAGFCNAQFLDSLDATAGLKYRFSSKSYLPFWLVANHFGTVADRSSDLSPFFRISNKNVIAEHEYQDDRGLYDYNELAVSYGLSVYNKNHFKSTVLEQGYVKLEYKNWSLRAGRFEETTGDMDPQLSTGSMGISGNALPVPKIGIAVTDYTNIPFTNGWLQFKGTFAHGWLGSDRYIKNSYYHEKTLFLRVGPGHLKFYAGIEHFAEWGGQRGDQHFDKSSQAFWNVVLLKESESNNAEARNGGLHAGDHRGVLDGGIYWENEDASVHGYLQKPFEGKEDISWRNKNMLAGFSVSLKNKYLGLQKIVAEIITTKAINDYIASPKRESYYNNNIYKTGWEYENNVIGTPLFTNRTRANKYFPDIQPFNWNAADTAIPGNANTINNRVFAIHIAGLYSVTDDLQGKTLLTYTRNYGSLNNTAPFSPYKNEFFGLQEFYYRISKMNVTIIAGVGFEWGQLSKTSLIGGIVGIEWNLTGSLFTDQGD